MIILPRLQTVVLCPPKNGSTTLHRDLTRPPWDGTDLWPNDHHSMAVPAEYVDFQIVGAVRDPYERAMSLYWHFLIDVCRARAANGGFTYAEIRARTHDVSEEITLVHFMEMLLAQHLCFTDRTHRVFLFRTTDDWLSLAERLDTVIHVERLAEEWDILFGCRYGDTRFSILNKSGRESWEAHRSPKAIELIDAWAEEDFHYDYARQSCVGETL